LIHRIFFRNSFGAQLRRLIGFTPGSRQLYKTAFCHSSIADNEYESNERLEFLGDAVLGAVIADYLYKKFPYKPEGYLTDIRSKMVSRSQLNAIALKMGVADLITYNEADGLLNKRSLAGNTLEALVGAIFLDKGFAISKKFVIRKIVKPYLDIEEIQVSEFNYKSKLLEWSQKNGRRLHYEIKHHSRSRHRTLYKVAAVIDGKEYGLGEDTNKKNAEKQAAKNTFAVLNLTVDEFMQ
jgi:ribonuclease-3